MTVLVPLLSWSDIFNFDNYAQLLPLVRNSTIAGIFLGVVGGVVCVLVMTRDLPFAVYGVSELSFAGASGASLLGASVDPVMATARGVPVRFLGLLFMLVLGCAVAISVQVVGALLILALLVTPAAAAMRVVGEVVVRLPGRLPSGS